MQRAFWVLLPALCGILWLTIQPVAAAPAEFHIAPNGSDQAAGSAQAPFRTLARARDAIRALKRGKGLPEGGARVIIHGGVYRLEEPFTLGPEDPAPRRRPLSTRRRLGSAPSSRVAASSVACASKPTDPGPSRFPRPPDASGFSASSS